MELTIDNASQHADGFLADCPAYPNQFHGRGIVTCGGGIKYGTCAWVLVKLLRYHGCDLPIEIWSLDDDEHDPQWAKLVEPLGVRCINATDILKGTPQRPPRG